MFNFCFAQDLTELTTFIKYSVVELAYWGGPGIRESPTVEKKGTKLNQ